MSSSVPHFGDLDISLDDQPALLIQARDLVLKIRPGWKADQIKDKVFSGGISNILVGIYQVGDLSLQEYFIASRILSIVAAYFAGCCSCCG